MCLQRCMPLPAVPAGPAAGPACGAPHHGHGRGVRRRQGDSNGGGQRRGSHAGGVQAVAISNSTGGHCLPPPLLCPQINGEKVIRPYTPGARPPCRCRHDQRRPGGVCAGLRCNRLEPAPAAAGAPLPTPSHRHTCMLGAGCPPPPPPLLPRPQPPSHTPLPLQSPWTTSAATSTCASRSTMPARIPSTQRWAEA